MSCRIDGLTEWTVQSPVFRSKKRHAPKNSSFWCLKTSAFDLIGHMTVYENVGLPRPYRGWRAPTGNLDSKNGGAVMDLLKELHAEGATICMVTHDPRYAHVADRSIHLFDGQVVSEDQAQKHQLEEAGFDMV